jgi:hypothetical protein
MKGGVLTFMAFLFLIGSTISQASRLGRGTNDDLIRVVAISICALMVMLLLYSYVDLGLQSARLMILVGGAMGLLSVLERLWTPPHEAPSASI